MYRKMQMTISNKLQIKDAKTEKFMEVEKAGDNTENFFRVLEGDIEGKEFVSP